MSRATVRWVRSKVLYRERETRGLSPHKLGGWEQPRFRRAVRHCPQLLWGLGHAY